MLAFAFELGFLSDIIMLTDILSFPSSSLTQNSGRTGTSLERMIQTNQSSSLCTTMARQGKIPTREPSSTAELAIWTLRP